MEEEKKREKRGQGRQKTGKQKMRSVGVYLIDLAIDIAQLKHNVFISTGKFHASKQFQTFLTHRNE